jgi:hypothetical protein
MVLESHLPVTASGSHIILPFLGFTVGPGRPDRMDLSRMSSPFLLYGYTPVRDERMKSLQRLRDGLEDSKMRAIHSDIEVTMARSKRNHISGYDLPRHSCAIPEDFEG